MEFTHHFRRPQELPFEPEDAAHVTIILGGLTWKHERLLQAVLQRNGHECECLPQADRDAHEIGKEFCNNGLCNPAYFTVGNLIKRLRELEETGLTRKEIVQNYIYFTAGSAGPCRYGMYETEFRAALQAAGYPGFRVILFMQDHGIKASSGQAGLDFSVDFGMCVLHAFILGDLLNELHRKLRPYEAIRGESDRVIAAILDQLSHYFRTAPFFDLETFAPKALQKVLHRHRSSRVFRFFNTYAKVADHLWGPHLIWMLQRAQQSIATMDLDRLQVKPVVKIVGEFWAQLTEGDGNFRMFDFLENEGAEVSVEPISTWVMYLLHQSKRNQAVRHRVSLRENGWRRPVQTASETLKFVGRSIAFELGAKIYRKHYQRLAKALGDLCSPLTSQQELASIADPHYHSGLRGGEGHLEVGKSLYYTKQRKCHMVLSLKPFGCLPSMQSDAVQASLITRNPEMLFLSVETAGEGAIHAYSRVQMALADARNEARRELTSALENARHTEAEVRRFVRKYRELRRASYQIPRHPGVISTAANLVMHADSLLGQASERSGPQIYTYEHSPLRVSMSATPSQQEPQ